MIAQRRTLTRTRHRTQSVKDHNVIRVGRELSLRYSTILFLFVHHSRWGRVTGAKRSTVYDTHRLFRRQ